MGIADIQPPVTAPVNINHHLPSPSVLAADVKRDAAIAVTVIGQRLIPGDTCRDGEPLQSFMMLMENRNISFMIDHTRLRGRTAGVTTLKNFVICS